MVQREVADRIIAKPGDDSYGSLSVFCQYYTTPKIIVNLSRKSFYPMPKINSSVVQFKRKEKNSDIESEDIFFKVVRSLFISRRKQLKNNLAMSPLLGGIDEKKAVEAIKLSGLSLTVRGETLLLDQIIVLANNIKRLL